MSDIKVTIPKGDKNVTYTRFIEIRYRLVRVVQVDTWNEVFRTRHVDGPELTTHHTVLHLLKIAVTSDPFGAKVTIVDFVVKLLSEVEWEIIVAVDQRSGSQ